MVETIGELLNCKQNNRSYGFSETATAQAKCGVTGALSLCERALVKPPGEILNRVALAVSVKPLPLSTVCANGDFSFDENLWWSRGESNP